MKLNKKNEFWEKINIKIYKLKFRVLYNKKNKKYEYKNIRNIKNEGVIHIKYKKNECEKINEKSSKYSGLRCYR